MFTNMTKITLARCDSYLDRLKSGIKHDTMVTIRTAPIHLKDSLVPDSVIQKAEEIASYLDKHYSSSSHRKLAWYHPTPSLQDLRKTPAGNPHL